MKAMHFHCIYFPLVNCPGLIQQLLSASASHYQHEKVKEMCCHGYMVCHLCSQKNICVSPSFVLVFFHTFLPADLHIQLLSMPFDLRGQHTLHNSRAGPTQVPQKGIHSSSGVTSAQVMMQVREERIAPCLYLHTSGPCCEVGHGGREEEGGRRGSMRGEDSPWMTQKPCKVYF